MFSHCLLVEINVFYLRFLSNQLKNFYKRMTKCQVGLVVTSLDRYIVVLLQNMKSFCEPHLIGISHKVSEPKERKKKERQSRFACNAAGTFGSKGKLG